MCKSNIKVGDTVVENKEYRNMFHSHKSINGVVTNIDNNSVATIRLPCGCKDVISVYWLDRVDVHKCCCHRSHHHCCC